MNGRINTRVDILDPGCFSSELLTPDDYIDWVFSHDIRSDECPSYILVRDVLRDMCEEQRYIMETGLDKAALSSILTSLPRLETVNLWFCRTIEEEEWVRAVLGRGLTMEESQEYHSDIIKSAIRVASESESTRNTIRLLINELST